MRSRWIRFERDDGVPLLINMDMGSEIRPADEDDMTDARGPEGYLVVCNNVVRGDIESMALMLGAETYSG